MSATGLSEPVQLGELSVKEIAEAMVVQVERIYPRSFLADLNGDIDGWRIAYLPGLGFAVWVPGLAGLSTSSAR